MSIDKELLAVIEKNLPALQVKALLKQLEEVADLQRLVEDQEDNIDSLTRANKALNNRLLAENEFKEKEQRLRERESFLNEYDASLKERDRVFQLEILELRLECAEQRHKEFMDLMRTAFKNPIVKEQNIKSGGNTANGVYTSWSTTENKEKTVE